MYDKGKIDYLSFLASSIEKYEFLTWDDLMMGWSTADEAASELLNAQHSPKWLGSKLSEEVEEFNEHLDIHELSDVLGVCCQLMLRGDNSISLLVHAALYKYMRRLILVSEGKTWDEAKEAFRELYANTFDGVLLPLGQSERYDVFGKSSLIFDEISGHKIGYYSGPIGGRYTAEAQCRRIQAEKPACLILNSPGGSIEGGALLARNISCPLVVQEVASSAALLALAHGCICGSDSSLAFHPPFYEVSSPSRLYRDTLSDMLMRLDVWRDFGNFFSSSERDVLDKMMATGTVVTTSRSMSQLLVGKIRWKESKIIEIVKGKLYAN